MFGPESAYGKEKEERAQTRVGMLLVYWIKGLQLYTACQGRTAGSSYSMFHVAPEVTMACRSSDICREARRIPPLVRFPIACTWRRLDW